MEQRDIAFNARAISTWSADRVYRVYVRDDMLYFIRVGGQGLGTVLGGGLGGMVGVVVGQKLEERAAARRSAQLATQEREGLEALLAGHKDNFRLLAGEVLATSIEPPATFPGHGPQVGRWLVAWGDKKWTLELPEMVDLEVALAHLPRALGDKLNVNVRWDEKKKRFQKV